LPGESCGDNSVGDFPAEEGQFFDNLQQQLDSVMREGPVTSIEVLTIEDADMLLQEARLLPLDIEKKKLSGVNVVGLEHSLDTKTVGQWDVDKVVETNQEVEQPKRGHQDSYSKLIIMLLAVASSAAVVLWFVWPSASVDSSLKKETIIVKPLIVDTNQSLAPLQGISASMDKTHVLKKKSPMAKRVEDGVKRGVSQSVEPAVVLEKLTVAVRVGNIRSAPNTSAKIVFKLLKGAVVNQLSREGDWYQVRLKNGTIAWAHYSIF